MKLLAVEMLISVALLAGSCLILAGAFLIWAYLSNGIE